MLALVLVYGMESIESINLCKGGGGYLRDSDSYNAVIGYMYKDDGGNRAERFLGYLDSMSRALLSFRTWAGKLSPVRRVFELFYESKDEEMAHRCRSLGIYLKLVAKSENELP
jgi:hypothetical protein